MVIYLQKKIKFICCYIIIFVFILFSYLISNVFCYIKYDDKKFVNDRLLIEENNGLKYKIEELSKIVNGKELVDEYVLGYVRFRDLYSFNERIVIKVSDEVSVGNAVINSDGLIGIVSDIKKDNVYVNLLTSKYNVSVIVNDCYGNLSNGVVNMIDKECKISVGDNVITSGLNDISKGIYIGRVRKINEDSLGYVLDIDLINNKHLNYVGVIK